MIRWMLTAAAVAASGLALAKLPPPDEAAKAKAADAAAKSAWQAKVDAFLLCKAQDRVAAKYKASHPEVPKAQVAMASTTAAAPAAPTTAAAPATTTAAAAPAAPAPAAAAKPAAMPTPTPATASQGGGTPVAAASPTPAALPPCTDPGPFASAPPAQKPLETSGAHSPAATAAAAPSVRPESAQMTPQKPGTATKP
jgi:hypothetical protein